MGNSSPRFFGWVNSSAAPLCRSPNCWRGTEPERRGRRPCGDLCGACGPPLDAADRRLARGRRRHPDQRRVGRESDRPRRDAARQDRGPRACPRDGRHQPPLIVYTSSEGSQLHPESHRAAGYRARESAADSRACRNGGWTCGALAAQIADDRAAGLTPACVAATAGTVNTGAIDPLDRIADALPGTSSSGSTSTPRTEGRRRSSRSWPISTRPGTGRQRRHRSAQVDVRAGRVRMRAGAGCAGDAGRVFARAAVPARRYRAAVVFGVRHPAEPRIQGAQAVDGAAAHRADGISPVDRARHRTGACATAAAARAPTDFELVAAGPLSVTCFRYRPVTSPPAEAKSIVSIGACSRRSRAPVTCS